MHTTDLLRSHFDLSLPPKCEFTNQLSRVFNIPTSTSFGLAPMVMPTSFLLVQIHTQLDPTSSHNPSSASCQLQPLKPPDSSQSPFNQQPNLIPRVPISYFSPSAAMVALPLGQSLAPCQPTFCLNSGCSLGGNPAARVEQISACCPAP